MLPNATSSPFLEPNLLSRAHTNNGIAVIGLNEAAGDLPELHAPELGILRLHHPRKLLEALERCETVNFFTGSRLFVLKAVIDFHRVSVRSVPATAHQTTECVWGSLAPTMWSAYSASDRDPCKNSRSFANPF